MTERFSSEIPMSDNVDPIEKATRILVLLGIEETKAQSGGDAMPRPVFAAILKRARSILATANPVTVKDKHQFYAVKTALEALEATERGEDPLLFRDQFRGHVEAVHGGKGAEIFGGRRVNNKPSAETAFLRAAMFVLWELNRGDDAAQAQVVKDAVSIEIIGRKTDSHKKNTNAVKKRVANIKNRTSDGCGPKAVEWQHIGLVKLLIEHASYRRLQDFL